VIPRTNLLRTRPAFGLAVIAVVIVAAAAAVLAVAGGDEGQEAGASPSSTTTTTVLTTNADLPPAPWRTAAIPRSAVPPTYVAAWDRARNHAVCALLFPLDGGPAMDEAQRGEERTPNDNGWDIFLTSRAASIEVMGLFDKSTQVDKAPDQPAFTKTWADGSVAKYAADVGRAAAGTFDPNSSPFEAVLTLPDQACAYRIYDTLGKDHLELVFDRLRLMG
jgi:hypothetical protein